MGVGEGGVPVGPFHLAQEGRVDPFRQFRRARDRRLDRPTQQLGRQAGGRGIDGLDPFQPARSRRGGDVVRVGHLKRAVVALEAAAHDSLLSGG